MKKIIEFVKVGFKQRIVYRKSTFWGLLASTLLLFLQIRLWQVLLSTNIVQNNKALVDMVAFLVINALLAALTKCDAAGTIASLVGDGSISCSLTRPISLKRQVVCTQIGSNLHLLLFTVILPTLAVIVIYGITLPKAENGIMFLISSALGAVIMFEIQYIIGLLAFFLTTIWFANFYITGFMTLFGATAIPLWYYPTWLQKICSFLPFRYITYEPIVIYLGNSQDHLKTLGIQLLWICILFFLEHYIWHKAERKLVVQGG